MIKTLQAGRAIAAISVAAFHLSIMMGLARYGGEEVFSQYTNLGNRGVDFFFVLSGFIILFAHFKDIDQPKAFSNYIYRRFIRLFPIYWFYTFVFVIVLYFVGGTDAKIPSTFMDWFTSLTLIRFTPVSPPLPAAWTLFHEIAFYAVFSLLIVSRRIGLYALGLFILVAIVFYQYPTTDTRTPLNVYTAAYNLYFVFGMGAFWLYKKGGKGIIEFALGIIITFAAIYSMPLPFNLSPLALVLGFSLILAGITKLEASGWVHVPNFLAFIGDASYTIYLTHSNFEGVLLKIVMKTNLKSIIGSESSYFAVLVGTILLGCVAFFVIEKPLLAAFRQRKQIKSLAGVKYQMR
jgi:peptidoglycan/LPS O-acetylase OafA/YrhL